MRIPLHCSCLMILAAYCCAAQSPESAFVQALEQGRLLEPGGAVELLDKLRPLLPEEKWEELSVDLTVALVNQGRQAINRYTSGDETPQQKSDFDLGARLYEAAARYRPKDPQLQARMWLCRGRSLLFEKKIDAATDALMRSIQLDEKAGYAYNALGMARVQAGEYQEAITRLQHAIDREPKWVYPRHNLALTYAAVGDYERSQREYEKLLELAPNPAYLHYNLGVLLHRLNRRREAERAYLRAVDASPTMAEAYNALGVLRAGEGKREEAKDHYEKALRVNPKLFAARHNLAILHTRANQPEQAIPLWLEQAQEFLPSRLSLAEAYARSGKLQEAAEHYRAAVRTQPDFVAARVALAQILIRLGDIRPAIAELQTALEYRRDDPSLHEQLGDLYTSDGKKAEAAVQYETALRLAFDGSDRRRLGRKLRVR